jgi:hypothetical protein
MFPVGRTDERGMLKQALGLPENVFRFSSGNT